MSNTVSVFKEQQEKARHMLDKLSQFIETGRKFGLNPNPDLMDKLQTALQSDENGKLKVALIGGFSEGKTSIAAAWLGKLDQSMNISQQESSNEVKVYHFGDDIELIDTPGLFGFKEQQNNRGEIEKYKEVTKKYVSEAHLVLYVMNSANPIKESHQDDLQWLFRELNLLSRTVFILSRFDEVVDVEDDRAYREALNTKKENVIERLRSLISLTDLEATSIKIVGVSANPFGEGMDYWLAHLDEFKRISRITTLQDATRETIEQNGGASPIVWAAQKSMIQDILGKQLPRVRQAQVKLDEELAHLSDVAQHLNSELAPMEARINNARIGLREFVIEHFTSLLRQVNGTDMITFNDFYEHEIGKNGDVLNAKIEQEFDRQCQSVSSSLQRISLDFNNEMNRFESSIGSELLSQGLRMISKWKIDNTQILMARDAAVNVGKWVGADLGQFLKFKPWGAINAAAKANATIAALGLAIELWDSYKRKEEEEKFNKLKSKIVLTLEKQRTGLLNSLNDTDFIAQLFPVYKELQEKVLQVQNANNQTAERKQAFQEWQHQGEIIEGEYRLL
jgi:GTP-binding protein EngB required for normal cell division